MQQVLYSLPDPHVVNRLDPLKFCSNGVVFGIFFYLTGYFPIVAVDIFKDLLTENVLLLL